MATWTKQDRADNPNRTSETTRNQMASDVAMISLYCWNSAQKAGLLLNPELLRTHAEKIRASSDVYWIDLEKPTEDEEQLVLEHFQPMHRLTRSDITRARRHPEAPPDVPKAEEFPDYLFVIANPLSQPFLDQMAGKIPLAEHLPVVTQLSSVLTPKVLITYHNDPLPAIQNLRTFLSKHEEQAGRGPDYLFHLILDAMVDDFAPVLDRFTDQLDAIEDKVFHEPTPALLVEILTVKRKITLLRKSLVYEREVLARMVRGDFDMIDEREIAYYRNVYDHTIRFTELMESSREMVNDLMQTHLAAASNKLNEIMKVLTMISTTVLPMTLVAGIYGMNFDTMPELRWDYGYPLAVVAMLAAGLGSLFFFRWRKWL